MRRPGLAAACVSLLLVLAACSTGGPMTEPTPATPSGRPSFETTTPGLIGPSGEPLPSGEAVTVPTEKWDAIVADLAARGVEGEPVLVWSEAVTWPNGALGCPKPGMSYTQALVDGMRVVVTVDGTTYDYRFGRGNAPRLCEA